jgi:hypothetical protein
VCAQEVERHAAFRLLVHLRPHRQAERDELRDEAPLRVLDRAPVALVVGVGQVRDRAVQAAGAAVQQRVLDRHQPVAAGWRIEVGAAPVGLLRRRLAGETPGTLAGSGVERADFAAFRS